MSVTNMQNKKLGQIILHSTVYYWFHNMWVYMQQVIWTQVLMYF